MVAYKTRKVTYSNLKSPAAKLESTCIYLSLASTKKVSWFKVAILGAYLNVFLDDGDTMFLILSRQLTEVLVKINPKLQEYVNEPTRAMLVQILKALYGLVQAAALWYEALFVFF